MTRATIIQGLKRAIRERADPRHRREMQVLLAALEDQYAALMSNVRAEGFQDGASQEQARQQADESRGFALGYQHGIERVIGGTGAPARRVDDEDLPLTVS